MILSISLAIIFNALFLLTIFSCHRTYMVNKFLNREEKSHKNALKRMYLLGIRFDIKAISIFSAPLLLISIVLSLSPLTLSSYLLTSQIYLVIINIILISLLLGNYFYFKTYNNYYDLFIFGLVEDDTKAVLQNIYDDYPIIKSALFAITLSSFPILYHNWLFSLKLNISLFFTILVILIFSVFLFLTARGTIRSLPLGKSHAQVSHINIINKMVPNGIIAMEWAIKDKKRKIEFQSVEIEDGRNLTQALFKTDLLLAKTPQNDFLTENPPHLFFALMESFGTNFLYYDDPKENDLLGNLRPHFTNSFVFKRFLAETNSTAGSLARLFFYSPVENISQSVAQKTPLTHTPFLTYKQKGYRTIFITAGNIMWRNLSNYLPLQYVDEIYDQNDIIDIFPEAKQSLSYWGLADEFALALAKKLLLEADKQPLFISFLSITNHPPYIVPKHYQPQNLSPARLENKYGDNDSERYLALATYQYANNALGNFIADIRASQISDQTIIAITGDHHVRSVRQELPTELFISDAVPFMINIPELLQKKLDINYDPSRLGSHKDIFPTLFSLSLSEAEYWHLGGRNMLAVEDDKRYAFAAGRNFWTDQTGLIEHQDDSFMKYQWYDHLLIDTNATPAHDEMKQYIKNYYKLIEWQISYLIHFKNEKT